MSNHLQEKKKAPRNRTLSCDEKEIQSLSKELLSINNSVSLEEISNKIILGDTFHVIPSLPSAFVDLLILDPPYNLSKNYNGYLFKEKEQANYTSWFEKIVDSIKPLLKNNATIYVCSDWKTSLIIAPILLNHFYVQNRITWEREKGRGAKNNWKNNTEDIWFCTVSNDYKFNVDAVKIKRKVIAPYRVNGKPKDWNEEKSGNYRLTHPSNIWSDITVPFWSMSENTDHPTQKPEKLMATVILASSETGDFVFDPFLGSGTTSVVASKLDRKFSGIEQNIEYCCWTQKRLNLVSVDSSIQGYADGVFWERNSLNDQFQSRKKRN